LKWLIWSIRTWFCIHDWEREEYDENTYHVDYKITFTNRIVSTTCKNCGWHRSYKKFK
jgi:hypothetical protein